MVSSSSDKLSTKLASNQEGSATRLMCDPVTSEVDSITSIIFINI